MICPDDDCRSGNVRSLPHYWESLPAESPQRGRYAPPPEPDPRTRIVGILAGLAGIAVLITGSIGLGLALLAGGTVAAVVGHQRIAAAEAALAAWSSRRICLACITVWGK